MTLVIGGVTLAAVAAVTGGMVSDVFGCGLVTLGIVTAL